MQPILLDDVSFWDVVWWMIMVLFFTMFIWMFIAVFADIFSRDMPGIAKALWALLIFVLPLLGILIYMLFRPPPSETEMRRAQQAQQMARGVTPTEEIARAQQLKDSGAISDAEFQEIKRRALM
jgi:hypothetical protein